MDDDAVAEFLANYFSDDSKIDCGRLTKWCSQVRDISLFMNKIQKEIPEQKAKQKNQLEPMNHLLPEQQPAGDQQQLGLQRSLAQFSYLADCIPKFLPKQPLCNLVTIRSVLENFNAKKYNFYFDWINQQSNKLLLTNQDKNPNPSDVQCQISWVYGFRCEDVHQPIGFFRQVGEKAASEKIIYYTGCVAIVYYPKLYIQKHYTEHDAEIISLGTAKKSNLVGTGELAEVPALHIWDSNTMQNVAVICGIHRKGISLVSFFKDDEFIASTGIRFNSPVLVYSVKDLTLVLSTFISDFALDLQIVQNYTTAAYYQQAGDSRKQPKNAQSSKQQQVLQSQPSQKASQMEFQQQNSFFVINKQQIILFYYFDGHFMTTEIDISNFEIKQPIICATVYKIVKTIIVQSQVQLDQSNMKSVSKNTSQVVDQQEQENAIMIVTGHKGGAICVWENFDIREEQIETNLKEDIVCIASCYHGVLFATDATRARPGRVSPLRLMTRPPCLLTSPPCLITAVSHDRPPCLITACSCSCSTCR